MVNTRHYPLSYVTRNGLNKEPTIKSNTATMIVTAGSSKGDRKVPKIAIGTPVQKENTSQPVIVILCNVPHSSHVIGLNVHQND